MRADGVLEDGPMKRRGTAAETNLSLMAVIGGLKTRFKLVIMKIKRGQMNFSSARMRL